MFLKTNGNDRFIEQIKVMLKQERNKYYLNSGDGSSKSKTTKYQNDPWMNEVWRSKITMWCFEVVDHFMLDRDVVFIAINYLDRYVRKDSCGRQILYSKDDYQLISLTALYMAVKIHGDTNDAFLSKRQFDARFFASLCRGKFCANQIAEMEKQMLLSLDWHLNPPTTPSFLNPYLSLFPQYPASEGELLPIQETARYISELSLCTSTFTLAKPSIVAYSAILIALEVHQHRTPLHVQQTYIEILSQATSLNPCNGIVQQVRGQLRGICPPSLCNVQNSQYANPASSGNASPICLSEEVHI